MIIRTETSDDFPRIYELVKVAFQTAKVSGGTEQDFVNQVRSGDAYIPELALVAEEGGQLIGHIMMSKIDIVNGTGKSGSLLLAPVCVALEHRDNGIGSALIRESMGLAREMGYTSVLLLGDPAYYHRFGFRTSTDFGITFAHQTPEIEANVMACELKPNALAGVNGSFDC
ncbi:MAG TPA: N-acetyltransferase [Armatimonadota bacterium]|jgi:putative acetyltransferase